MQYLVNLFWKRWIKEYLPTLHERQKWSMRKQDLKVGDVVLIMDKKVSRGQWPLGRVVEVFRSKDKLNCSYLRKMKATRTI